jgi:predicted RNA methylase
MLKAVPDIEILPSAIRTFISTPEPVFMPLNIWEGIVSANEWFQKGIEIPNLGTIFPLYGVWAPTSQSYLNLFQDYLKSRTFKGTAIDLGCGTGVLGMMLAQRGMTVFGVDSNFQAAKCANLNAQKLGLDFTAVHDSVEKISLPSCDVLVCNPPWIPGSPSSELDKGNFDEDEKVLKACFEQTKKLNSGGRLLLIHSDLPARLGLQKENRVDELCVRNGLIITNVFKKEFGISLDLKDPFKKIKDGSHILLYEIKRI